MQQENRRRHLFSTGILLFLLAILFGLIFPKLANPRMGLSGHLVGLFGGLFLLALGSIWKQVNLPPRLEAVPVWLALYGTYGNFVTTVLAATIATVNYGTRVLWHGIDYRRGSRLSRIAFR